MAKSLPGGEQSVSTGAIILVCTHGRVDEEATGETSHRESDELGRDREEELIPGVRAEDVLVEELRKALDEDDVCRVDTDSSSERNVRHDGNEHVLLDGELAWVKRPFLAEEGDGGGRERPLHRFGHWEREDFCGQNGVKIGTRQGVIMNVRAQKVLTLMDGFLAAKKVLL